jgi:hypothetical protein
MPAAAEGGDAADEVRPPLELDLTNHFLIAMPSMLDPIFGGTVVYLCEHNHNGALGVVINKPTDMTMDVLFDRINLKLEIQPDTPMPCRSCIAARSCSAARCRWSAASCCIRARKNIPRPCRSPMMSR